MDGKIQIQTLFSEISNSFTYEFWVKPRSIIKIPTETSDGISGIWGQQWIIGAGHGGMDGKHAGVGVSIGLNGIAVFEHSHNHFPATLVQTVKISNWTHVAIVVDNKIPSLYINGNFVKSGMKSKMEHLSPSGIFGTLGSYGTFVGQFKDIRIWDYPRTNDQIMSDYNKRLNADCPGLFLNIKKNDDGQLVQEGYFFTGYHRKIAFPANNGNCLVSIIIPVYNKWEYTQACLKSIYQNTNNVDYEIIIADDMSTDRTKELSDFFDNTRIIKDGKNRGFLKNCNNAVRFANGKYLMFLNNDTIVQNGWLNHLVDLIESDEKVGLVGAKLVKTNGELQEAGSIIFNEGSCLGYGRGDNPNKPEYSFVREVHYCSGACILVKKDLFNLVGKFDEQFSPAYYEEVDLAMKIRELGYKVMYQPLAIIHHHEFGSSSSSSAISLQKANREKFKKKWKKQIKSFQFPDTNNTLKGRNIKEYQTKILVVDDRIPDPELGSGLPRTFSILQCLAEMGVQITYFPNTNAEKTEPYTTILQQKGIEVMYDTENKLDFYHFFQDRKDMYDAIWISRPHNMNLLYEIIKSINQEIKIIYDAEALFSSREIQKLELEGKQLSVHQKSEIQKNEIDLINKADFIVTVSNNEKKIIESYIQKPIIVIGHTVEVNETNNSFEDRNDILFVGGFLSSPSPNEDAILYFVKYIYPIVYKKLGAKLWIVGTNNANKVKKLASNNIIVTGRVENLSDYYNHCKVFIIPTRYAAGIPLKGLEAMSYGLPAIVTPIISDQLNVNEKQMLIGHDPKEFAEKLINLYENKNLWNQLRKNGLNFVKQEFNKQAFIEQIKHLLNLSKKA
ncbi:glycosyltransferase [Cytobacillus firmus]|uniref:glycosyltransferase n=1 Tax=Cytobacillus firmus TaxID=1399 RepID=UPI0021639412|nr:glycosyltransferase [Cytobacillus firmus]MCS0674066.1 glycosyltransferase [Cytobacillus firmus]